MFFEDGRLFESTGHYGQSQIREVDLETGRVVKSKDLPDTVFGEGSVALNRRIFTLTWRAGKGFIHALDDFEPVGTFDISGEGWGLTHNGQELFMSNGSNVLQVLDPKTLQRTREIEVNFRGKPLRKLNELEWVKGAIYANVWQTDLIAIIDPVSGNVSGVVDISNLHPAQYRDNPRNDVANGIAYDPEADRIMLTGKKWPALFEVQLVKRKQKQR